MDRHREATADPEIRTRQADVTAPPGFADAIGWLAPVGEDEQPNEHVSFTVADRDATATAAERLGGAVLGRTTRTGPATRSSGTRKAATSRRASSPRQNLSLRCRAAPVETEAPKRPAYVLIGGAHAGRVMRQNG